MSEKHLRTVILSDTHLGPPGRGAVDADRLRPLWQGADRLIINGDVAEIHDHTHRTLAAKQILKLQASCEADGVELTLLSGNHDPLLTDHRSIELNHGEVVITHGDALHPAVSPWTEHRRSLLRLHEDATYRLEADELNGVDAQLSTAQYAAHFKWDEFERMDHAKLGSWRKRWQQMGKFARVAWYWHTLPRAAATFTQKYYPDARYFIFGHIHRAGIWKIGGRVMINTGAYDFPSNPHAVIVEANEMHIHRVRLDSDKHYQLANHAKASFALTSAA